MQAVVGPGRTRHKWFYILSLTAVVAAGFAWYLWRVAGPAMTLAQMRAAAALNNWQAIRSGGWRYVRNHPEDAEAILLLGRAELMERRYEAAVDAFAKIPATSSYSPEARWREGQAWRQLFRGVEAERCFRQAIEQGTAARAQQPLIDAARLGLVQLMAVELRTREAHEQIWELYRTSPAKIEVLELLGRLDVEGADPHDASQELSRFIDANAEDLEASRALAHHYIVLGRAHEARRLAEQCTRQRPDWVEAWEALIASLIESGDHAAAERMLRQLPSAALTTAWYWKFHGMLLEHSGLLDDSEAAYRQAVEQDPYDGGNHYRLGRLLQRRGAKSEAADAMNRSRLLAQARERLRELYRQVIVSNQQGPPVSSRLCSAMGEHYELLGLRDGAIAWYRQALERDPEDMASREGLSRLVGRDASAVDSIIRPGDAARLVPP